MTTKPKTRKAAAKRASRAPKEAQLEPWRDPLIDAQDSLDDAAALTNAIRLIAAEMNEFEGEAFCAIADAMKAKIDGACALIEAACKERWSNAGA
ncbi:MAG: hypothetical protein WBE85_11280 [Methylocella sp.]